MPDVTVLEETQDPVRNYGTEKVHAVSPYMHAYISLAISCLVELIFLHEEDFPPIFYEVISFFFSCGC